MASGCNRRVLEEGPTPSCGRRHRSLCPSSLSKSKGGQEHPSTAFIIKSAKEREKVRQQTQRVLHQQMLNLFERELFYDLVLECDSFVKRCHSCLFLSRVPNLYKQLYENFKTFDDSTAGHLAQTVPATVYIKIPFIIETTQFVAFLKKIYSEDDIRKEEVDIIRRLRNWSTDNMNQNNNCEQSQPASNYKLVASGATGSDCDIKPAPGEGREGGGGGGGGGTFSDVSEIEEGFNAFDNEPETANTLDNISDSVMVNQIKSLAEDSLEICKPLIEVSESIVNSESLTNVSESNENASSREASSLLSDDSYCDEDEDEEEKESPQEDVGPETGPDGVATSSSCSQMVRSSTFDLLCQMPLEQALDIELQSLGADNLQKLEAKGENLNEKRKELHLDVRKTSSSPSEAYKVSESNDLVKIEKEDDKEKEEEESLTDLDAETPIADPQNYPRSPGSLFQFFVDMDALPSQGAAQIQPQKTDPNSGFLFFDLNQGDHEAFDNNLMNKSSERSNSASVIVPGKQMRDSESLPVKPLNSYVTRYQSCNNLIENRSPSKQTPVNLLREDEIPLLPMSPILRHKSGSNDKEREREKEKVRRSKQGKAKSSLDLKNQNSHRLTRSAEYQSDLMQSSWRSEGGKVLEVSPNSPFRGQRNSPSVCDEDSETVSDVYSDVSSISSSFLRQRQGPGNRDEDISESFLNRTLESCSKLGEDLLRMFFDEVNADIAIQVEGKDIKAHKCILVTRCPYFQAMFSGGWSENESNCIHLQGFSYSSVHFALCHIYSGAVAIPKDNMNLGELALLADLLALDTLREVVLYELKMNYCHFFHKPCRECIVGVLHCLGLSAQCGLHNLHQRCLAWVGKHFTRIWPTKAFATLQPDSLMDACYQSTINQMSPDNILEVVLDCERLTTTLPRVKWAEPVFGLIAKLMEDSCNYVAANYDLVVSTNAFIALGRGRSWNISTLEETFLAAINGLTPDVGCKTLVQLGSILVLSEADTGFGYGPYSDPFVNLTRKMYRHCERYLIQNASSVVHSQCWSLLSNDVQQHIKDSAVIVFEFEKAIAPRPKLSSSVARKSAKSSKQSMDGQSADSGPKSGEGITGKGAFAKKSHNHEKRQIFPLKGRGSPKAPPPSEDHIYDEVPLESANQESYVVHLALRGKGSLNGYPSKDRGISSLVSSGPSSVKKSQVAKVSPFTVNSRPSPPSSLTTSVAGCSLNDLVAEIDADSNLVNHCLQEAELLEQELTRKLKKQQTTPGQRHGTRSSRPTRTHTRTTSHDLTASRGSPSLAKARANSTTKLGNTRPPFK